MRGRRTRLTKAGRGSLGLAVLVALAALNTNANLLYLVLGLLLSALAVSALGSRGALEELRARWELPARASAGEPFLVVLGLSRASGRRAPRAILLAEAPAGLEPGSWPLELQERDGESRTAVVARAPRRGRLAPSGFVLRSEGPLGLATTRQMVTEPRELLVRPRFLPLAPGEPEAEGQGSERPSREAGEGAALRELRPYVPGDNPRRIHWKASAKQPWPLVKETQRDAGSRLRLALEDRPGLAGEAFEAAVVRAASRAAAALRAGLTLDLDMGGKVLEGLQGPRGLEEALDALALVEPRDRRLSGGET